MQISSSTPAVVAGGASGLGAAAARSLAERGAPVAVLDLDSVRAAELAREIDGVFVAADVTDDASVDVALSVAREAHGQERICVNCAGIAPSAKTAGKRGPHDMEAFTRVISVNLIGTMRVMSRSAAGMIAATRLTDGDGERGVIVNTASIAAFDGQAGQAAYAASKGGVASLTLPAARDLAESAVRVVSIAPGIFDTPMLAGLPERVRDSLAAQVPFPSRLGDPAEFGALVCAIVENPYISGETIRIDGALRMSPR